MELTMRLFIYCTQVELCGTRISELNGIDNACSSRLNCAVLESRS